MKRITIITFLLVLSGAAYFFNNTGVIAFSQSPRPSNENCTDAQVYIAKTLRKNDLRARVDRIQFYESMHHDLEVLTSRMEKNDQPGSDELKTIVSKFRSQINSFKANYELYDSSREAVSTVPDCLKNYTKFKTALKLAQKKRAVLNEDIKTLNNQVTFDIVEQLSKIEATLKQSSNTGGN